jgi:hypothetical protein
VAEIGDIVVVMNDANGGAFDNQGRRCFRSWTSTSAVRSRTPLPDTPGDPFAGLSNMTVPGGQAAPPWRLGVPTQANATC